MRKQEIVIMAIAISSLLLLSYVNELVLHTEQRDLASYLIPARSSANKNHSVPMTGNASGNTRDVENKKGCRGPKKRRGYTFPR